MGGTTMPNASAQPMNHFHRRTTIEGSAPTFGTPQQTMASIFGQGYTQTAPRFSMPNITSAPYTPGSSGRTYTHASGKYQAPYSTVAYTDPIPLPGSSLHFVPNHTYQNAPRFNACGQLEATTLVMRPHHNFPLDRSRLT
jgi:hypothetical protein